MRYVSRKELKSLQEEGYTGTYRDFDGLHPEWKGRRTILASQNYPESTLLVEGDGFEVVEDNDPRSPKPYMISFYTRKDRKTVFIRKQNFWAKNRKEAENWAKMHRPLPNATFRVESA
jgi:hypothetical protein